MIQLKVTIDNRGTNAILASIQKQLDKLPAEAATYFRSITPIRTGNARSRTKLNKTTIEANYAYAQRLDDGYSRQAPKGMIDPTLKFIEKRVKEIKGK